MMAASSPTGPVATSTWPAVLKDEVPMTAEMIINYAIRIRTWETSGEKIGSVIDG
jgi:hypothetical protein